MLLKLGTLPNLLVLVCAMVLCSQSAKAATLFATTSAGGTGELFRLDPATGAVLQDVGALNNALSVNYPVTGLAFDPISGVLYGSTGNANAGTAARLVTINPTTGAVTEIGSFNAGNTGTPATMADLAFDSAGNLFGIGSVGGPTLYSINLSTGQATPIGSTVFSSTGGGGLSISPAGIFYGSPTATASGARFGTYNPSTGAFTQISAPALPLQGAIAGLSFDGSTLYGINLGPSPALHSHLVTIDPATGAVTDLGPSADRLDAIAFQPSAVPEPASVALVGVGIMSILFLRRQRK